MHQVNGAQRCFETQTKYAKSPAGWRKGRVTRAHGGRTIKDLIILHRHVCVPQNHCSTGCGSTYIGKAASPAQDLKTPGGTEQNVGCCKQVSTQPRLPCTPLPASCFLGPRGDSKWLQKHGQESLRISMRAVKPIFPLEVQLPLQ